MAHKQQRETTDERHRLSQFVITVWRFVFRDRPKSIRDLERTPWERYPLAWIRVAARDVVEMCQDIAGEELARLDSELASKGLPTMSAMRNATYRKALAVLARGRVRTEEEWHVLNGFVVNQGDGVLSPTERQDADRLMHEFRRKPDPSET
jgi:hypothetical protein